MPASPHPRPASALDRLADEYVDLCARLDPFLATSVGIPGHDGEVTDFSPAAEAERTEAARTLLSAIAEVPDADSNDAVTRAALTERLGLQIERADQHLDIAMVNNLASTLQIRDVLEQMPSATADDWEVIAERMAGFPRSLRSWGESLLEAAGAGVVSARRQLQLGAEQARGYADTFFPAFARGAVGSPAQRDRVTTAAAAAADGYRETAELLESLIDRAPEADAVGRVG